MFKAIWYLLLSTYPGCMVYKTSMNHVQQHIPSCYCS